MNAQPVTAVSRGAKIRGKKAPAKQAKPAASKPAKKPTRPAVTAKGPEKADSKQAKIIALLRRPSGATIDDLVGATGWQAHSVRGVMSGSLKKKLKLSIDSEKVEGRGRVYRIR